MDDEPMRKRIRAIMKKAKDQVVWTTTTGDAHADPKDKGDPIQTEHMLTNEEMAFVFQYIVNTWVIVKGLEPAALKRLTTYDFCNRVTSLAKNSETISVRKDFKIRDKKKEQTKGMESVHWCLPLRSYAVLLHTYTQ